MTFYDLTASPVGQILLIGDHDFDGQFGVSGLFLHDQRYHPRLDPQWVADPSLFAPAREQLAAYFGGAATSFDFALAPHGSDFQKSVWTALSTIEFGTTVTYGAVAMQVADRSKTRAVAAAIGRNPIAIVVPCHRVIGADGSLTGYAGGLDRKRWLLDHEATVTGAMLPV